MQVEGWSLMHLAAEYNDTQMLGALLKMQASVSVADRARKKAAKQKPSMGHYLDFVNASTRTEGPHGGVTHRACRWADETEVTRHDRTYG